MVVNIHKKDSQFPLVKKLNKCSGIFVSSKGKNSKKNMGKRSTQKCVKPKNLRQALDAIQEMLLDRRYSAELWDLMVSLRGPDSRDRKLKNCTTALIRTAAFPKRPCLERSVFAVKDTPELAKRRKKLFKTKAGDNHFRDHVRDSFLALGLELESVNEAS
jgi:hypothetical protein